MLYLGDACVVSVVLDQLRFVKTSIEEKVGHSPLLVLSQCKGRDYIAYSHSTQPSTATSEKREQPLALNLRSVLASKCAGGTHTHLCQCTAACWTCHPQYQRMCTRSTAKMSSNPLSHRPRLAWSRLGMRYLTFMTLMLRQERLLTFLSVVTGHGRNVVSPCMVPVS